MIEALNLDQSLKAAELQDGDIICFQRFTKKGDKSVLGKEFDLGENKTSEEKFVSAVIERRETVLTHIAY